MRPARYENPLAPLTARTLRAMLVQGAASPDRIVKRLPEYHGYTGRKESFSDSWLCAALMIGLCGIAIAVMAVVS